MKSFTAALCACVFLSLAGWASAATVTVNAGGDLQAAINAAQPGDTILLQAGAVFTGNYILPVKNGTSYITIRSSAPDSSLPPAGTRITPAYAGSLAKVRSNQAGPAFATSGAASYWRLMFLEILPSVSTSSVNLIELGSTGQKQNSLALVAHHLVIDRCYIHGDPAYYQRRAIALNSSDTQILNSYIAEIKAVAQETQAIAGWNGPGPFLIENNYLEASGEDIMFGGDDPSIVNLVPSNITIRRNLISRPMAWINLGYAVKNLIELKNAENVLIDGNTIENNWASAQQGYSIVLTPRNQSGTAPWSVVRNVTIQNNVMRHLAAVFNVLGFDYNAPSQQTSDIVVRNNLIYDVSTAYGTAGNPANGWIAVFGGGPKNITFDHNTIDNDGNDGFVFTNMVEISTKQIAGFVLTNNLFRDNAYGIFGDNSQEGNLTLSTYAPGAYVQANAIGGAAATLYPVGNDYPTLAQWMADFVGRTAGNYALVSTSLSKGAASDGTDIGVNFTTLNAALSGASAPPPPSTPPPSGRAPFSGTPIALPGTIQAEDYDKGGEGVAYHDTTAGNSGGAYRGDDVDIRQTTDSGGAYNLKSVRAGEWLTYSVNIASAGTYAVDFRVASSGTGGTVHLEIDGSPVTSGIVLPDTGGWNTWATLTATGVTLPAGAHVLKLALDSAGSAGTVADINWMIVRTLSAPPPPVTSTPYTGTPIALPGRIEAENFDNGGEGIAYHDATPTNPDGVYRNEGVDLQVANDVDGGYKVKTAVAGEWLKYTVNVGSTRTYAIDVRVSSSGAGGTFHLEVDGVNVTGALTVPNTGGWSAWTTLTKAGVSLTAGQHVVRLVLDGNGSTGMTGNFNWIAFR
jgi:carbohydrate binding protein with CBM6 domain/parallel beta helix pectate lyase-like protein